MIPELVDTLVKNLKHHETHLRSMPYYQYVRNYRTVGLILPRGTGKTTFLKEYHNQESSLLFVHDMALKLYLGVRDDRSVVALGGGGQLHSPAVSGSGAKYSCFLVNEFELMTVPQMAEFEQMINAYKNAGVLHKDFYVLKLST